MLLQSVHLFRGMRGVYQLLFVLCWCLRVLNALRVNDNIRIPLTSVGNNCMRLLNGTHQVGCQSNREGNTGVLAVIRTSADIDRHLQVLPWGLDRLIALVNAKNLDGKLLSELNENPYVVGVLLYRNRNESFDGFSEDAYCPNKAYSFYPPSSVGTCEWNKRNSLTEDGFFFGDYSKPIFMVTNETEISMLMDSCYRSYNRPDVSANYRCVARMQSFMLAAGDARLCRERQTHGSLTQQSLGLCDELFDYNVITVLPALDGNFARADAIVLAARMDSFSLFSGSRGGDISVLVSLISALSVAKSIGNNRAEFEAVARRNARQLMLAFFHVESLGYGGSSRFVYDMQNPPTGKPKYKPDKSAKRLQPEDLSVFVELQQFAANHSTFYLHADGQIAKSYAGTISDLHKSAAEGAQRSSRAVKPLYTTPNARLPPASYQSFLKARQIPGFLIAPFEREYDTRVLNSFFDTQLSESDSKRVRDAVLSEVEAAASVAMQVVLDYVGKNEPNFAKTFTIDKEYAGKLVDCLIFDHTWNCTFFAELFRNQTVRINPHITYIEYGGQSSIRKLVNALTINAVGDTVAATNVRSQSECLAKNKNQDLYTYYWQNDPQTSEFHCYQTSTYLRIASSPAFEIEDYDLRNTTYAGWVESRWDKTELEIFLDAGYKFELHALGVALIVLAFSGLFFYLLDESWFINPTDVLPAEV